MTRAILAIALAALACARDPEPAAAPAPPDALPTPPAAEASRFSVPLEYDFASVIQIVERVVPGTFGSLDSVRAVPNDDRRHYAFTASRGPFTAFASGNLMHLRTTIEYTARGFYKPMIGPTVSAGCGSGKDRPRITVELATPLTLSADWHLVSKARVVTVAAASAEARDHCDVTIFHKDVTQSVIGAAQTALTAHLGDIDAHVHRVDLTAHATDWWKSLSSPIRLADSVWLMLSPEALSIGKVAGRSTVLTVPVSLRARPHIVAGAAPALASAPLPRIGRDMSGDGFHIALDGTVDYGMASTALTKALAAKVFDVKGHTIRMTHAALLPQANGRLAMTLTFTGDARGTLVLAGAPHLDQESGIVSVPDLSFGVKTENTLLKSYAWLASDILTTELRQRARIPVKEALTRGRALLTQGLNRKIGSALTLSGTVDSVAVRELFVTRDGLVVRAEATGHAGVAVKQ